MKQIRIIILFILLPGFAFSQKASVLSLQKCIDFAIENSYRLQAKQANIEAATEKARFDKFRGLPKLSGELAGENHLLKPYDFSQVWASVHADWSLGDYLLKTDRASRQQVQTLKLLREQSRLNAIEKIASLYVAVLLNQKQKEILESRLTLMRQHYNLALSMWKAGLRTQLDVLQTQSAINKIEQDTVRLAINGDQLKQEMARLMGFKNASSIHLQPINTDHLTSLSTNSFDLNKHPLVQAYTSKIKAKTLETEAIKARNYPLLSLGGGYFNDADPTADGNYWRVNVGIRIPIYYGHQNLHLSKMMHAQSQSLSATQKEIRRKLEIHINQLEIKQSRLKNLLQIQQEQQKTAKKTVDFSEINYKAGLITNLEVLTAQQELTKVSMEMEASRLDYLMNLIEFYISTNHVDKIKALATPESGAFSNKKTLLK